MPDKIRISTRYQGVSGAATGRRTHAELVLRWGVSAKHGEYHMPSGAGEPCSAAYTGVASLEHSLAVGRAEDCAPYRCAVVDPDVSSVYLARKGHLSD